jgi:hypothetical protein
VTPVCCLRRILEDSQLTAKNSAVDAISEMPRKMQIILEMTGKSNVPSLADIQAQASGMQDSLWLTVK